MKAPFLPFLLVMALLSGGLNAQSPRSTVVASTSWTAAIARAAGAPSVVVIAPAELKHPPEYEIKPSDLDAVRDARLVVYGGYEKFAQRLIETSGSLGAVALPLVTSNVPSVLVTQVNKVAEVLGTASQASGWADRFTVSAEAAKARILAAYPDKKVVVQAQFKAYAEWLGFDVVGVFGPGELSPSVVLALIQAKPALVIDNYHNPSGPAVSEALKVPYVQLINFPGKAGTVSLEDVLAFNERELVATGSR